MNVCIDCKTQNNFITKQDYRYYNISEYVSAICYPCAHWRSIMPTLSNAQVVKGR